MPPGPGYIEGVDLSQAVTGPPSEYAQASLEAECYRLGPGGDR